MSQIADCRQVRHSKTTIMEAGTHTPSAIQKEKQPLAHDKNLTTTSGIPVGDNQNSLTAGPRGPVLLQDFHLLEKMAHFNRERIPERVVHAKGSGAHGTLTVTGDITAYTTAKVFNKIGKKTDMFARFSTVGGEKGSADTSPDPRGFPLNVYTQGSNWDI